MAPPKLKPASPPNPNPNPNPAAAADKKNKVTPLQVAFLVERYLADNGFSASLSAFRSDAAHLFSRTSSSTSTLVPPKGLLPLSDILHDYISLKESRLAVDSAMHAMHTLVSTYYLHHSISPPPPPPFPLPPLPAPPPSSPPLVPPFFVRPTTTSSPPAPQQHPPMPGAAGYASPIIHYTQTSSSVVLHNSSDANNMLTPASTSLPTKKRKATKSAAKITSASKKTCTAPSTSSHPKGKNVAPQLPIDNLDRSMGSAARPSSAEHSVIAKLPVQGSTVAKSLFKPLQSQVHSSPSTPQQNHPMGNAPASYQTQNPSSVVAHAHSQQEIASSQCSIVSSKTLIVSPLKGGTYYSVERSYHVSSPLKSSTQKSSKREHVKGKLNFDSSDARPGSTEHICEKTSSSTTSDGEKQDDFDIDFTNFDIFDGEFSFSELLLDFDLDNEGVHCENPSTNAEIQRLEPIAKSTYAMADPLFPGSVKPLAADPTEDINSQGATSVTSVRAITKRIKIVSPVKGRTAS